MSFLTAPQFVAIIRPSSLNPERQPLIQEHRIPIDEGRDDSSNWILEQWNKTVAFESKAPIPLHIAAMGVGITICAVVDKVTYSESHQSVNVNGAPWTPPEVHFYSWYHVMTALILFDLLFITAWVRNSTPTTPPFVHVTRAFISCTALISQVLFIGRVLNEYHGTWTQVCSPLIVATVFLCVQYQWQALIGITLIAAALKADGLLLWDWALVFFPMWLILSMLFFLAWLLPNRVRGEDPSWTKFKKWFWLMQIICEYGACIPLAIKLQIGSTVYTNSDGIKVDWFPYRTIVAIWLLPVTCVVILAIFVYVYAACDSDRGRPRRTYSHHH